VLAGFFAASIGAAQAVVTDVTPPAERAGGMGVIGAAFGAGMVVGPVIGGFTAELSDAAPFYTVAILAAANFVAAWIWLPESRDPALSGPDWSDFGRALVPTPLRLLLVVHDRAIGLFLYLFFHIFSAFAVLEALTTLYVGKAFGKEPLDVGLLFMCIGAVLVITQGVLLRRLVATFGESRLVGMGLVAMGGGLMLLPLLPVFWWFYPVCGLIAFGTGITFPAFTSLYSKVCMAENAGELLGLSQAMGTAGRIVGPFVGGLLMQGVTLGAPFVFAGAMMLAALAMFGVFRRTLARGAV
jgi:MFS family permease